VHMLGTGLTGDGDRSDQCELKLLHWFRGSLHVCKGSSFSFFKLCFGGLRSLLEFCFVSDMSSRCPCLSGPRLVFFK
jgi:hypothetical protein